MKLLIAVTAAHMYMDIYNGQEVNAFRPCVVERTPFIQNLLAAQKIELLEQDLKDEATDKEFVQFLAESNGDKELAIDAFMSKFSNKPEVVKAPAPKTAAKGA